MEVIAQDGEKLTPWSDYLLSKNYQETSFKYNQEVISKIIEFLSKKNSEPFSLAVDIGCGTGQSSRLLAPYFNKVIGTDISETQIQVAKEETMEQNVEYRVSPGENNSFVESSSADIVTCFLCIHLFDLDKFFDEVDRMLKPGGVLAVFHLKFKPPVYPNSDVQEKINALYDELKEATLGRVPMWNKHQSELGVMKDLPLNYSDGKWDSTMTLKQPTDAGKFLRFITTMTSYKMYKEQEPNHEKIMNEYYLRFLEVLRPVCGTQDPSEVELHTNHEVHLVMCRKPVL